MVKKVARYRFSNKFKKDYQRLTKEIQKRFDDKLALFLEDMDYPSLRVKKIQGKKNRWEGSLTDSYRFTFEFDDGLVLFRVIGTHDILQRESRSGSLVIG